MTPEAVLDVGQSALIVTMLLAAPLLLSALAVGLLIGVFQAATQIQEITLSFIPKLIVVAVALFVGGPWMLRILTEFSLRLFQEIPGMVG
ncbi:flagellar biosynthesis protein FliQ [Porticoccus sp.]|uniref:flagellar biosynthesis protein FliQ n=1 Tax=Porticoccus sp. TaxID=2024853 RepID=UPI000C649A79|nr:flagellar biosynthesis protein FliQ [Porticoccus sp.]MAZ70623.1 flagellar biosynthetic protein FliQ [Porticoccus sp.]|tara:strand:+ start:31642 stop:31911 length:270 start_codon:yes stop_codon:yes gene_type:complete